MIRQFIYIVIYLIFCQNCYAGLDQELSNFWKNSLGGSGNVTKSGHIKHQMGGYYSGGSSYLRTPVKTTKPLSFSLPNARAGCGGIDIFKGGFSYINSAEIEELMKSTLSNAVGVSVSLALETLSPVMAEKVEEMLAAVREKTSMSINSCEMAQNLVGGLAPKHDRISNAICSQQAHHNGKVSDYIKGKHECGAGGKRDTHMENIRKKNDLYKNEDINIVWEAMNKSNLFGTGSKDNKELLMSLTGTIIIKAPKEKESAQIIYKSSQIDNNTIATFLYGGGDGIKGYKCIDDNCLNLEDEIFTVSRDTSYVAQTEKIISHMIDSIKAESYSKATYGDMTDPVDTELKNFLSSTSLPIYKIASVYATYPSANSVLELSTYAELIAATFVHDYLSDVLQKVVASTDQLVSPVDDEVKELKEQVERARTFLNRQEFKRHNNRQLLHQLIQKVEFTENIITNDIIGPVADSLNWSQNL